MFPNFMIFIAKDYRILNFISTTEVVHEMNVMVYFQPENDVSF